MEQYPTIGIQAGNSEDEIGPIFQMRNSDSQLIQRRYSKGMKMRKSTLDFRGVLADFRGAAPTREEDEEVDARLQRRNSQQNSEEVNIPGGNLTTPYAGPL